MLDQILIQPAWLTLLPPIITLTIAFWRKNVIAALLLGLITAEFLLAYVTQTSLGNMLWINIIGTLNSLWQVLLSPSGRYVVLFSLFVGTLIALLRLSGGVAAFIERLKQLGLAQNKRQAGLIPTLIGCSIFVDTNLSILTSGLVGQKLFDKFKLSRAKLAYVIDTTCSPLSSLILINGWGAYLLSLIVMYDFENPVKILGTTILLNFYSLLALAIVFFTVITGKVFGPMKHSKTKIELSQADLISDTSATKTRYMLVPLATMIIGLFVFMFISGKGNFLHGQGALSVFLAVISAIIVVLFYLIKDKAQTSNTLIRTSFRGMYQLIPLALIIWFSMALGASTRELGTGIFISQLVGPYLPLIWVAPLLFISSGLASFTTGTSWGTFALMIPIGMSIAETLGIPPALILGAIVSGGVWGDHCSPISDTTVLSSLASGCEHLEHVKTQLPYAISVGFVSIWMFLAAGLWMI